MKHTIFMVTFRRDFNYLEYCLRSIEKFVTGMDVRIKVPHQDFDLCVEIARRHPTLDISVTSGDEWKDKGMLWHMNEVLHSDENCPTSDFIYHFDPDTVFTKPFTTESMVKDGKPVIVYYPFAPLIGIQSNYINWQNAVNRQLGFRPDNEFMQRFPLVYKRDLYARTKGVQMAHTGEPVAETFRKGRNQFPQDVVEYNVLGAVAFRDFHDSYVWVNKEIEPVEWFARQAWSHRDPTEDDIRFYTQIGIL